MSQDSFSPHAVALPQARRQSLVDSALEALSEHIASGMWPVGARIPTEGELGEILRVGRNTVREAIRVLSHAGILEVRQGDGTYVRSLEDPGTLMRTISRSSLREHFELRTMLEIETARLAALRRSTGDLQRIKAGLNARGEWAEGESVDAFLERDSAFHRAIAEASRNGALIQLYRYFLGTARDAARAAILEHGVTEPSLSLHEGLYHAIEASDPARAARAARAILRPLTKAFSLDRDPAAIGARRRKDPTMTRHPR
ncbi:GntR family transcriptional regulator [Gluconacetobacter sacchari DSM 12717]|uniref:FadR family transcriptional regulator n=2 Tax=Gluconacetobacter sacchari TaxID=92759 RepID=A0A7W4NMT0_9PROT|nr:FadR/GntR family transcriptional regulator [Gluconacetobacter sacchari]MBB2160647.1 FadR family transcriptional regulator [Gluconacetobacter sacchari]GBQ20938.1 GntR family transcriptional regulator [Gluconacetobacter sacchari DSM 12717]